MECTLCNSEKIEPVNAKIRNSWDNEIRVYQCKNCEVHFLYPYYSNKELKDFYNGVYRKEYSGEEYYREEEIKKFFTASLKEAEIRVNRVKNYVNQTHSVLEIGCASGYFLDSIKSHVKIAKGTEWDEHNASYAKSLGFDIRKNPSDFKEKFDRIFIFHVLEHIKEPTEFLNELKSYLKEDGIIFIEVPNNEDILLTGYDIQEFKDFYYQSAHIYNFNKKSLDYVISKATLKGDIFNIQRYDISNHIQWLKDKKPGGQGAYDDLFTTDFKENYTDMLIKQGKTDTLFAVCRIVG